MNARFSWSVLPRYPLLFVLLGTLWGGSFVAIEVGLQSVPALLFAALRYDIAGLVVLAYAVLTTDRWHPTSRDDWRAVLTGGVFIISGYQSLLYLGTQYIPGAIAAVIVSLSPILTAGFAGLFVAGDGLEGTQYLGVALGSVGVILVVDPFGTGAGTNLTGVALVVLAAALFALGSVLVRPLSPDLPARSLQAWAMLVGGLLIHGGSYVRSETIPASLDPVAIGALAYLAICSGAVAYLIYFELLDTVGAAELNLVAYMEPVMATVFSVILLGHTVAPHMLVGFLTIFVGFAAVKHDRAFTLVRASARNARRVARS